MRVIIDYEDRDEAKPFEWIDFDYDNWDDFGYKTAFVARYKNKNGENKYLGVLQIGFKGMEIGRTIDHLEGDYEELPDGFFSLGTSEHYYLDIYSLGESLSKKVFTKLKDIAYDLSIFDKYREENVLDTSLLRGRTDFSVRNQLHRIAHGGVELTPYNFSYIAGENTNFSSYKLDFNIEPDSNPPTNIHVIIGRNGTGKTYLIKNMIRDLLLEDERFGRYINQGDFTNDRDSKFSIANVLCVAFSPFDNFSELSQLTEGSIPFSYIGLDREKINLLNNILEQFMESFSNCMINDPKAARWERTIDFLRSDPTFEESQVYLFMKKWTSDKTKDKREVKPFLKESFNKLSSGHKVVLLILTACVDKLEEKSIIFIDEPENHLHPPLLSAFIRAISYLLINRNSLAIISTHSPVVLQEVPKRCVWKLSRSGNEILASRPEIETFGATIGSLTREVFGLEVNKSGFINMISEDVNKGHNYEEIMDIYNGELGDEARSILQTLLIIRNNKNEKN